jgi:hypothetical protein
VYACSSEKADALNAKFPPPPLEADTSDIDPYTRGEKRYPLPVDSPAITKLEILRMIRKLKLNKAPGPDRITNNILCFMAPHMVDILV